MTQPSLPKIDEDAINIKCVHETEVIEIIYEDPRSEEGIYKLIYEYWTKDGIFIGGIIKENQKKAPPPIH